MDTIFEQKSLADLQVELRESHSVSLHNPIKESLSHGLHIDQANYLPSNFVSFPAPTQTPNFPSQQSESATILLERHWRGEGPDSGSESGKVGEEHNKRSWVEGVG
jgi:hypothetical protein